MMPSPDNLILAMLAAQPQQGSQLLDAFRDPAQLGHVWHVTTAQIYAVLRRLERDGWIVGMTPDASGAPRRAAYHATPNARARVMDWLNEAELPSTMERVRVDFLSRVYAARLLFEPVAPIAARQAAACATERARLAEELSQSRSEMARLALTLQIVQMEALMIWIVQSFPR